MKEVRYDNTHRKALTRYLATYYEHSRWKIEEREHYPWQFVLIGSERIHDIAHAFCNGRGGAAFPELASNPEK